MSDNVIHLPISTAALRRFRKAKYAAMFPTMFEPPPVRVKKAVSQKGRPIATPSYGENVLVIDSDGRRYPSTAYREMIAALVLAELLKRGDIRVNRTHPYGPYRKKRQTWIYMTDRMLKAAIGETPSIIFCKRGRRHGGSPFRWLPEAVRLAVDVLETQEGESRMSINKAKERQQEEGLIGLFGHLYIADPASPSVEMIQFQFRVIRKMEGDRYVIQYFSFLDGSPTNIGVLSEAELLGPDVKLYVNQELWNDAYQRDSEALSTAGKARCI